VFDGLPESSVTIKMGATFTYFYNLVEPGTYLYHCHVEATEHMQMGMLGNLYVRARKDTGVAPARWAYDDDDDSTQFHVEYPIQMASFDSVFHDASFNVQPLPFADMKDDYFVLNGRGYPDTIRAGNLPAPAVDPNGEGLDGAKVSQRTSSRIVASAGQRILLRISNLSVTDYGTLASLGIPMRVVARDARLLRGGDGTLQAYTTNSVTLGGGESADVILDTTGVSPGTYFLYTTNLHRLANGPENFGGQLTHVVVN
jgi:FtsP/CotA-like multicopper oxidase with cupredoxin domain